MITKVKKAYVIQDSTGLLHVIGGNKFRDESGTEVSANWATDDTNTGRLAVDTGHLRSFIKHNKNEL